MTDGQGRALGSGSIPDVPLSPVGDSHPYFKIRLAIAGRIFMR